MDGERLFNHLFFWGGAALRLTHQDCSTAVLCPCLTLQRERKKAKVREWQTQTTQKPKEGKNGSGERDSVSETDKNIRNLSRMLYS